eukprot:SAG31_NODE_16926_length_690_cov_0.864636_1_plen_129_part_01
MAVRSARTAAVRCPADYCKFGTPTPLRFLIVLVSRVFAIRDADSPTISNSSGALVFAIRDAAGLLNDPLSNLTYWYGSEGYPGGDAMLNTKINVYSSSDGDLMNWRHEGVAFEMPRRGMCAAPAPNPAN